MRRTPKKEKAAESLAVKLFAAFGFCKAARVAWLPKSPSRSARAQTLRKTRALSKSETRRLSRYFLVYISSKQLIDGKLTAQSQPTDDCVVALNVRLLQIIEQTSSLRDHLQKAATRMIVLFVNLEMLGEFVDALA